MIQAERVNHSNRPDWPFLIVPSTDCADFNGDCDKLNYNPSSNHWLRGYHTLSGIPCRRLTFLGVSSEQDDPVHDSFFIIYFDGERLRMYFPSGDPRDADDMLSDIQCTFQELSAHNQDEEDEEEQESPYESSDGEDEEDVDDGEDYVMPPFIPTSQNPPNLLNCNDMRISVTKFGPTLFLEHDTGCCGVVMADLIKAFGAFLDKMRG